MAVFKLINEEFEKTNLKIFAKNVDVSSDHWRSFKNIKNYMLEIENANYIADKFNGIIECSLKILKDNIRIKEAEFYADSKDNKLILFVISDIPVFRETELFSREMSIILKNSRFSIIEVFADEIKKDVFKVPETWTKDEKLTNKLTTMQYFAM